MFATNLHPLTAIMLMALSCQGAHTRIYVMESTTFLHSSAMMKMVMTMHKRDDVVFTLTGTVLPRVMTGISMCPEIDFGYVVIFDKGKFRLFINALCPKSTWGRRTYPST